MKNLLLLRLDPQGALHWAQLQGAQVCVTGQGLPLPAGLPTALIVPAEQVVLTDLEVNPSMQRHLARWVPFALEEQLIGEIEQFHVALGPVVEGRVSVAVCQQEVLLQALAQLDACGIDPAYLWPEMLLLPRVSPDSWSTWCDGERQLLRSGTHQGVGGEAGLLPVWLASEAQPPRLHSLDTRADLWTLAAQRLTDEPIWPINLRQGRLAQRLPLARWWQRWRVAAVALLAVFLLYSADLWLQGRLLDTEADALRAQTLNSYRAVRPQGALSDPLRQLQNELNRLQGGAAGSALLPSLQRFAPLLAQAELQVSQLQYNARQGEWRLELLGDRFQQIESVRTALAAQGFQAELLSSQTVGERIQARLRLTEGS